VHKTLHLLCKKDLWFFVSGIGFCKYKNMGSFHLSIDYRGKHIEGEALPLNTPKQQGIPLIHKIIIDGKDQGIIRCTKESWAADKIKDQKLVDAIGSYIHAWYE
jgi:hypothetical protein